MKFFKIVAIVAAGLVSASPAPEAENVSPSLEGRAPTTQGLDIDFTTGPSLAWNTLIGNPYYFAYIQSTYGLSVSNPFWSSQKSGARSYRFLTGGVHHPNPTVSDGSTQAEYFTLNGGGWTADQKTIRGALYLEANKHNTTTPYCYGLNDNDWITWIKNFIETYYFLNDHKFPVIFTSYKWWAKCTLGFGGYGGVDDLWYSGTTLPTGWSDWKFQQLALSTSASWRVDNFNGDYAALTAYVL